VSHIFISHVEEDADIALEIALGLEKAGIRSWIYEIDSIVGTSYIVRTGEAVAESDAVAVIISPDSLSSNQVTKEVVRAHESGKKFLPILRGISHVEFQQRQPEWREAIGSATSITLPKEGVNYLIPKVIEGAKALGIKQYPKIDAERINKLGSAINNLPTKTNKSATSAVSPRPPVKERKPWYKKPLTYVLSSIAVVAIIMIIVLKGGFNGNGDGTIKNTTTPLSGNTSEISSNSSLSGSSSEVLSGQTTTPISGSTSNIIPTTSTSTPTTPISTATGVINSSGQLASGASTLGTLKKGETQLYYFTAETGDAIFAVLTQGADSDAMLPWLELVGPDGKVIGGSWGSVQYTIDYGIAKTGKYGLRVRDYANAGGNYVLSFMQLSKSVNPLTSGVSLQGQLKVAGDVNWYTFDANAGDAIFAVLDESSKSKDMLPWLELLGPDGKNIGGSWGSVEYTIDYGITKAGKYTLRVRDYANTSGNYVLSFMQLSKSVNPLTSGISLQGQLKVPGDVNWYTFDASAGEAIFAVLSEGATSGDMLPWLELLGPDGKNIGGSWGSVQYTIDYGIAKTGKYTLRVRDYANTGGNYVLSFMQLSKSVNPLTPGVSLQGQLKVPGDVNWYTFDANVGDVISAVLSEGDNSASMLPWLELLGPDGKYITGSWGSVEYTIDYSTAKTGKYTLRVRDYANAGGNYVLSFNLMTP
jgi:hypothetical protein